MNSFVLFSILAVFCSTVYGQLGAPQSLGAPQGRGAYGSAPSYAAPAPAPSYGSAPSYAAPAPSYSAPAPPSYPGPAKTYTYPAQFAPQSCGTNLLFSCQPAVAEVPCQGPPAPPPKYSPPSYGYSAPAPPSYKDASENFGTIDF